MTYHFSRKFAAVLAVGSALSFHSIAAANSDVLKVGVNSAVKGDVTIKSGEQAAKQAVITEPVFLGDEVTSNSVGSLQVLLKDQSIFTVGPQCNLTIDKFVFDPTKNTSNLSAKVKRGMFRFTSGRVASANAKDISIETPTGTMGVRGTIAEGLVGAEAIAIAEAYGVIDPNEPRDNDGATLFILRGPGSKNQSKNARGVIDVTSAGKTVTTRKAGQAIFVQHNSVAPSKPFDLSLQDVVKFEDRLRTEPTGAQSYAPFDVPVSYPNLPSILSTGGSSVQTLGIVSGIIAGAIVVAEVADDDDDDDDISSDDSSDDSVDDSSDQGDGAPVTGGDSTADTGGGDSTADTGGGDSTADTGGGNGPVTGDDGDSPVSP